jgi:hypothetical protein
MDREREIVWIEGREQERKREREDKSREREREKGTICMEYFEREKCVCGV